MAEQVQVIVRIRPLNEKEKKQSTLPVVSASSTKNEVTVIRGSGARQMRHVFKFDGVFSGQSTQAEVFDRTLRPMIHDVLNGFESTVFAYGQTGSGKTFSMQGVADHEELRGLIPRFTMRLFERVVEEKAKVRFEVYTRSDQYCSDQYCPDQHCSYNSSNSSLLLLGSNCRMRTNCFSSRAVISKFTTRSSAISSTRPP